MWRSTLHPSPFGLRPALLAWLFAGALLAGCNDVGNPMAAGPVTAATAPVAASGVRLPPGSACAGEIDRFQAVVRDDLATGNVEQKVYDQIEADLHRAAAACAAGRGAEAHAIVAATKARHGYRA